MTQFVFPIGAVSLFLFLLSMWRNPIQGRFIKASLRFAPTPLAIIRSFLSPTKKIVAAHHTMLYKVICAATIGIASISVLTQLILLPWLHQHTENLKAEFESRLRKFHHNARQFDEQLHRLGKLTGAGVSPLLRADASADENGNVAKMKRQIPDCPPPRVGSPGPIGEPGEDGESGEAGEDGAAGLDAMTLLMQEAQKCVICPQGPAGPIGAPGQQGFNGPTGEKGEMGEAGTDGLDGEQGPEGLPGLPGISGKAGKKGPPGSSAPGGTGPPGPPGVKGPIGPTGKQGERGRRNFVIGMPGQDGRSGKQGLDGLEGKPGGRGDKGSTGEDGADARFCPCPSELNKLGNGGEKPHSHLMPPPGGLPTAPTNPTKALPPAPAQAPSSKSADEEERKPPLEEGTEIGGGPAVPVKQPTSAAILNNASIEAATNLRIAPIRPGEQPTTGKEAAAQMNNYEDAYPNYESGGSEDGSKGGGGKGRGKSGEEAPKPQYDDEIQLNGAEKGGQGQQQEEVKPAISENGGEGNGEEEDEDNQQQEAGAAPMATRRFVYVTKRPRPKL